MNYSGSLIYDNDFVAEQISFSTADIAKIEFYGETAEFPSINEIPANQIEKFRLIDGELMQVIEDSLPSHSRHLSEDSTFLNIINLCD